MSLTAALPLPKYTGENEQVPAHAQPKGTRIVGAGSIDQNQIVVRKSGPPPYRQRGGWRPRDQSDYGDGGAFPEILVAQYPLDCGRKDSQSNALAVKVDGTGGVDYTAIARRGHNDSRVIHTSFKDLIPLRQQANSGDLDLDRPDAEAVEASTRKTKEALEKLVAGASAASKPKTTAKVGQRAPSQYVRYTPADKQMGQASRGQEKIIKIVETQRDPFEPPKHKHKKIPGSAPSPPPPVMHSPPRRLTAEDQEAWKIPPPISNWKNPKGYTVPLDKRLASDGRGLQDVTINDKFASFAEALFTADRHAREEVKQRAQMQQKLAEKEKAQKEDHLRMLAQRARDERSGAARRRDSSADSYHSRSRSASSRGSYSDEEDASVRRREQQRKEQAQERERKLRQSRMGGERRMQMQAREQGRDISEKVALGLAKPSQQGESMFDARLFNQSSGFESGFNEDQAYDKPLFAAQDTINSIYRPRQQDDDDDGEDEGAALEGIQKKNRFEVLGKVAKGFKGAETAESRSGPVQFEKDLDPFGIDAMIKDATKEGGGEGSGGKRYGLEDGGGRSSKRVRVEDRDD